MPMPSTTSTPSSATPRAVPLDPPEPYSSRVRVDLGHVTHPGLVRPNNEDHYLIARAARSFECLGTNLPEGRVPERFDEVGYVLAVADGMGGHASGEVASSSALRAGVRLVLDDVRWSLKITEREAQELMEKMARYVARIHQTVTDRARSDPKLFGMGTTLTVAYSVGADLFTVHVGDSRVYLFRQGRIERLTTDHTVAQKLADAGVISQEEVPHHRTRHMLTNVIGGPHANPVRAELHRDRLADGDQLLLCTDGLSDLVDDAEIAAVLSRAPAAQSACEELRDLALQRGGRDNITAVLARYTLPEDPNAGDGHASPN